ncbi:facilitated trehalose transporter Tret1 isoform X1 [Camponotus floridanus]|uniref:facilitated trehalose transporter Tret1 isoform X1 n=1 Tax=Camponotus floridanus TaxID=104421 RepID=UPI000DC67B96|nr:facilitated trehalose transporter Tret1 isoform X1 [Camponotus floridanus]
MKKVYLAAIAGNLGMLSVGQFLGWSSPSLAILMQGKDEKYPIHLTPQEAAWVASLPTSGGIAGAIICTVIINIFGRKNIMLFTAVPSIISWLMIAFATSLTELYISKFIAGLAIGIALTVTPIYLAEISPPHIRGNLTSMSMVAVKIGMLMEFVIGPFLSVQNLTFVSLIAPCLFMLIFIWLPESPYYLMRRNAKEETINSLVQLRGKEDVYNEACNIEQFVKANLNDQTNFRELLCVPRNRRTLIIMLCLSITQKMTGYQAILNYAQIIFDQMNVNLEGKYLTMILGVVQLIFTIISMFITDHSGRRSLLIISCIGTAFSTAMVATYFNLQYNHINTKDITWLPVTGIITYVMMYALGLSSQPFTLLSEIFPINVKALGSMIILIARELLEFVVITSYMIIADIAGTHVPFWIFTACNFAGALFIFFYVPETKGKTLEQIQEELQLLSKQ